MNRRGSSGGGGHGAAGGTSSRRNGGGGHDLDDHGRDDCDGEGKLRIHLKRSCTDRKVVPVGDTELGLTTDDWHKFKRLLASKTFSVHDTKRIRGEDLTAAWAQEGGFREPVIVPDKTGMGLKVPDSSFTVADVAQVVGEDKAIRPIHVGEQANIDQSMTLAEFAEYFETCTKPGQAILNMISLEFSDTPLAKMVQSPQLVRDIDWVNRCWPEHRKEEGQFPKVQYYCLMSQGGSYTDFHVDFGGTSVWYHILRGKKEFLLIRPTKKNLELYEDWIRSPTQSQVFFGDVADTCYRVVLNAGETLMIPSGWIHAVFTPKPSLVFGGNFLHSLNIQMQLQVHAIEVRAKTAARFRFPFFKEMMLFAASSFLSSLRVQQGDLKTTPIVGKATAGGDSTTDAPKEMTETDGGKTASEEQAKQEGEKAKTGDSGSGRAAAVPVDRGGAGHRHGGDGVSLGSWEREGLRPLLEACRAWMKEEEGSDDDAPEEWHLAATMAGCADVNEMLEELGRRVSALEETASSTKAAAVDVAATMTPTTAPVDGGDRGDINETVSGLGSATGGNSSSGGEAEGIEQRHDPGPAAAPGGGAAALLLAAAAAETLGEEDEDEGTETTPASMQGPGPSVATAPGSGAGASAVSGGGGGDRPAPPATTASVGSSSLSSYSIPKLKISLRPQQEQAPSPRASDSGGVMAGADIGDPTAGSSKARAGLKLVLKGPALSSAGSSAGASAGAAAAAGRGGGGGGAGKKRGRQQQPQQRQRQERRWKEDYDDSDEFAAGDSSDDGDDDDDDDGDEEEEEEEGESGDDTRVGRGGKRKARPLGSRLRAIARLGDDAAGGGSEDDNSADEYKPDEADDVLPEDHKIYADELPRETKRGKSASSAGGGGRSNTSGGRPNSTWSGFGSSAGGGGGTRGSGSSSGAGGRGRGMAVIAGVRRLNVTKQEALRSKGLFKIAPPSKVPAKPSSKEKKPLTAKQKLLAKMRR